MSPGAAPDDDKLPCTSCGEDTPGETAIVSCGCVYCPECWADWQRVMAACAHEWEAGDHTETGEEGRFCRKCGLFVPDDEPNEKEEENHD